MVDPGAAPDGEAAGGAPPHAAASNRVASVTVAPLGLLIWREP